MILTLSLVAAKSFGKFKDSFLAELHAEITSHEKQVASGHAPQPVQGIVVHDSEVLEPDPVRMGGLMRNDAVSDNLVRLRAKANNKALPFSDTLSSHLQSRSNLQLPERQYLG